MLASDVILHFTKSVNNGETNSSTSWIAVHFQQVFVFGKCQVCQITSGFLLCCETNNMKGGGGGGSSSSLLLIPLLLAFL